jgi:hypothetical protein
LAQSGLAGEQLQDLYLTKATCYAAAAEFQKCLECCQKALDAAPEGPKVRSIKNLQQRAERELAAKKVEAKPEPPEPAEPKAAEPQ